MSAAPTTIPLNVRAAEPRTMQVTLLELVQAVSDVAQNEREVIATVVHMLCSGSVRLCGNLRDVPVEELCRGLRHAES
jgi:hypothetical protein